MAQISAITHNLPNPNQAHVLLCLDLSTSCARKMILLCLETWTNFRQGSDRNKL